MKTEATDTEIEFRLTPRGRLPYYIPCLLCYGNMRRLLFRRGAVYECRKCESETTLDAAELKAYRAKGKAR